MNLLPPKAIVEVSKVLTFGAEKYDAENWRKLDDLQNRYTAGALRHIFAHMDGEQLDPETELSHLAHALCCLLFKLEIELEDAKIKEEKPRETNITEYRPCDKALEAYRQEVETDYKKRSMQHIKHLVQYYKT
jgi:hypothetical protein